MGVEGLCPLEGLRCQSPKEPYDTMFLVPGSVPKVVSYTGSGNVTGSGHKDRLSRHPIFQVYNTSLTLCAIDVSKKVLPLLLVMRSILVTLSLESMGHVLTTLLAPTHRSSSRMSLEVTIHHDINAEPYVSSCTNEHVLVNTWLCLNRIFVLRDEAEKLIRAWGYIAEFWPFPSCNTE